MYRVIYYTEENEKRMRDFTHKQKALEFADRITCCGCFIFDIVYSPAVTA